MGELKKQDLEQFTGTENYHYHPLCASVIYTDGVHYLEQNGAGWLVDLVASHLQTHKGLVDKCGGMLFTAFKLDGKGGGRLEARADSDKPVIFFQDVEYTDLPFDQEIWAQCNGGMRGCWVMLLPSEY